MSKVLQQNDIYTLSVDSIKDTEGELFEGYTLVNNKTGVKEIESFSLAEMLGYIAQTEGILTDFFHEQEAERVLSS